MRSGRYLYAGALVVALVVGLGLWKPTHVKADRDHAPKFRVDASWPHELPAPAGYNYLSWPTPGGFPEAKTPTGTYDATYNDTANRWVQGEVAGSCIDQWDNVYTFNRAWETGVGAAVNGTVPNSESGAIDGNDATAAHALPSPPVVAFTPDGKVIQSRSFGNPTLHLVAGTYGAYTGTAGVGRSAYMPHGAHGCFVDYKGNLWVGGNGDGIVQEYNPAVAGPAGAGAAYSLQIGTKDQCDTTTGICGATANNSSQVLLNEPPDIAVDPEVGPVSGKRGDIYIADGYGNYRVVVFNPALASTSNPYGYVGQWGQVCVNGGTGVEVPNGTDTPGNPCPLNSFGATGGGHPHCVVLGNDGNVYLCDRPNSRILVIGKTSTWIQPSTGTGCTSVPATPATCTAPTPAAPIRAIYIGTNGYTFPSTANPAKVAALLSSGTRACDMDLYPNVDYLASTSPTHQKYIVNVALDVDNVFLLDKSSGDVLSSIGKCGIAPCPGHNAGEFAYSHTGASDSKGNVYVAETITGRRIQKFVPVDDDDHYDRDHH